MKKVLAAAAVVLCGLLVWQVAGGNTDEPQPARDAVAQAEESLPVDEPAGIAQTGQRSVVADAPAPAGSTFELTIQAKSGETLEGAIVHFGREDQPSQWGRIDAEGIVRGSAMPGAGIAWVWAPGVRPTRLELPRLRGELEAELPDQPVVRGQVLVDGQPPGESLGFGVNWREEVTFEELSNAWLKDLFGRSPLRSRLDAMRMRNNRFLTDPAALLYFRCQPDGWFELRGVRQGELEGLSLFTQTPYRVRPDVADTKHAHLSHGTYAVPDPPAAVQIELQQGLTLRARVVFEDGTPVDSKVQFDALFADGSSFAPHVQPAEPGRLVCALGWPPDSLQGSSGEALPSQLLDSLKLTFMGPEADPRPLVWSQSELDQMVVGNTWDLGELIIPRMREVCLLVQDAGGDPAHGAVVLQSRGGSAPCGPDGRLSIRVPGIDPDRYWVAAPGWAMTHVAPSAGQGTEEDPLVLVLDQPANSLRLQVPPDVAGRELSRSVVVETLEPLFPTVHRLDGSREWFPQALLEASGTSNLLSARVDPGELQRFSRSLDPGMSGITLAGIRPGVAFRAFLTSPVQQGIAEVRGVTPPAGKGLEVRLEGAPSSALLKVRLKALGFAPLASPKVVVRSVSGPEMRLSEAGDGTWLGHLFATGEAAQIYAAAENCVPEMLPIELQAGEQRVGIQLRPSEPLTVRLVDDRGLAVSFGYATLDPGFAAGWNLAHYTYGDRITEGVYRLANAPPGPVNLFIWSSTLVIRRTVQRVSADGEVTVVVPRTHPFSLELPRGTPGQRIELRWQRLDPLPGQEARVFDMQLRATRFGWQNNSMELPGGRYRVTMHRPARDPVLGQTEVFVSAEDEMVGLDLPLPPAEFR